MKFFLISFLFVAFSMGSFSLQKVVNTASASSEDSHEGHGHDDPKKKHKSHDGHKDGDDHEGHDDHDGHKDGDDDHKGHDDHEGHKDGDDDHKGHDDHGGGKSIGKGKAIEAVDEKLGFKLSAEAIKTLKLKLKTVDGDTFTISKSTLVTSKKLKGVYRYRGGFFKLLKADIIKELSSGYKVKVSGVDFGDQIVVNGTGLLRTTDVYSTDKSEYGHSH